MQFKEFGKIPRLYRRVVITEKIYGTNAAVGIDERIVGESLHILETLGSKAAPGFFRPEGIIIYHTAGGYYTKVTLNGDGNKAGAQL